MHLEVPAPAGGNPDLTIDLWDGEETGIRWPLAATGADIGDNGVVTSSADGRLLVHARPHAVVCLNRQERHLVGWIASSRRLSVVERAKPLHLPLTVWCSDQDLQVVHAGLIAHDGHGVLLAGVGGAGKSTATLACVSAGFDFLGDDCVALCLSGPAGIVGYSLYGSIALEPGHSGRFPLLSWSPAIDGSPGRREKSLVFASEVPAWRLRREASIRALAVLRIVDDPEPRLRPATRAEALLALAPSSLVKRAVPGRASLRRLATLVARVRSYRVELGPDLQLIPRAVERVLAEALRA